MYPSLSPDYTQAKSGLATCAKFIGPDDISLWNAVIPIRSVLAQYSHMMVESHSKIWYGNKTINTCVPSSSLTRAIAGLATLFCTLLRCVAIVCSLSGKNVFIANCY